MASESKDVELPVIAPQGVGVRSVTSGIQSMAKVTSNRPKISLHQVNAQ